MILSEGLRALQSAWGDFQHHHLHSYYASTQEPPHSKEDIELEEEFLNMGVHIDINPNMEMNDYVAWPTPTQGLKWRSSSVPPQKRYSRKKAKRDVDCNTSLDDGTNYTRNGVQDESTLVQPGMQGLQFIPWSILDKGECICPWADGGFDDIIFLLAAEKFKDPDDSNYLSHEWT